MWEPSNVELVQSWLSYRELRELNLIRLNGYPDASGALNFYCEKPFNKVLWERKFFRKTYDMVWLNPRAFLVAYNKNMDFMDNNAGCVNPETFPKLLTDVKGRTFVLNLFYHNQESALALLNKTMQIESQLGVNFT